jgi:uncharacterized protein YggE
VNSPVVTVRGEASHEVPPDLATVSAGVVATGSSSERVAADLARGSERLAGVLERYASVVESSSTSGMWIHPVTDRRSGTKITGYRGSFDRTIVVHDLGALSDLVLALAALPQTEISGPWWSLRSDSPAHREVRLAAIADGRRRADDYAAAFGARVTELIEVSDLDPGLATPKMFMARAAAMDGGAEASFDFEPQPQTVSGAVTLRFAITAPVLTE